MSQQWLGLFIIIAAAGGILLLWIWETRDRKPYLLDEPRCQRCGRRND